MAAIDRNEEKNLLRSDRQRWIEDDDEEKDHNKSKYKCKQKEKKTRWQFLSVAIQNHKSSTANVNRHSKFIQGKYSK